MDNMLINTDKSDRIISTTYKTIKAHYPGVPFSHLDKDSHVSTMYLGGRKSLSISPKDRYSQYISLFNDVAKTFGYKFFEFQERGTMDGWFVFKNADERLPNIHISPGYVGNSHSFLIRMTSGSPPIKITDCNANLQNHQDCFNLLYKKLHFAYKMSDFDDIKRDLALLNLRNKLKNK